MGVSRKQSTSNFPKKEPFLPLDPRKYVYVSEGKKCSFFGKFDVLCFLETAVFRFVLLPYYRRYTNELKVNLTYNTLLKKDRGKRSFNTIGYFFLVSVLYVMISNHALILYDWMEYSDKNHSHQILKYITECLLSCKTEMNWKKVKKVLRSRRPEAAVCWYFVHRQI